MKAPNSNSQHESISCLKAVQQLRQRINEIAVDADASLKPLIFPKEYELLSELYEGDQSATLLRRTLTQRADMTMLCALRSGDLHAWFEDGLERQKVPGWAWEAQGENLLCLIGGNYFFDPLLPDAWWRWSHTTPVLVTAEFQTWLASIKMASDDALPELPSAYDATERPPNLATRDLPTTTWVTLSEAVSWIAFNISLDCERLRAALDGDFIGDGFEPAQARLKVAVANLAEKASGGTIAVYGKYLDQETDIRDATAILTEQIPAQRFIDFAQFDNLDDGLRFGTGLTWVRKAANHLERQQQRRKDHFASVKVNRNDLLRHFSAPESPEMRAMLAMLPASLPDVGLVMGLEEALNRAAYSTASNDAVVWVNTAGELTVTDNAGKPFSAYSEAERASYLDRYVAANRLLCKSLQDGILKGYVAPVGSSAFAIPRPYWNQFDPERLGLIYNGLANGDVGAGCPVLIACTEFEGWHSAVIASRHGAAISGGEQKTKFTDSERKQWIREQPSTTGDRAHKCFKAHPRYDGTKQAEFRREWSTIKGTKRGRPSKIKS